MEDDIISHLSDNVVDNILMFLPLRDAVRTSALSQKWRHNWETLPQLVFDSDFEESLKQYPAKNELLFTIYQILLLHRAQIRGHGNPEVQNGRKINMLEVFGCLPSIEYLHVDYYLLMILAAGDIPERFLTPFNLLKTLILREISLDEVAEFSLALCLIKSSPHLQKLEISVDECPNINSDGAVEFLAVQNRSDISLDKVQEVEMLDLTGRGLQMGFVKLLLAKSPMLERMHVHPLQGISTNEELRLLTEITRFCWPSAVAEIIYSGLNHVNS
ncbi:hypothetical protein RCOM_1465130 [Ricinus communis]|uniref:F-box domain-containing protein n=1 Tax=Ricinus communis TaxID=3988 RepID=B9RLD0_RICCO|nr:hypothetical protein RCOM_1465130 [Ricinus communis]